MPFFGQIPTFTGQRSHKAEKLENEGKKYFSKAEGRSRE